jgi:hypothetical protein
VYGEQFGNPEFQLEMENDKIIRVEVLRGSPCGATWEAVKKIVNLSAEQALIKIGIETQYFCTADPSNWDPKYGKSPVHLAAELHNKALARALKKKLKP